MGIDFQSRGGWSYNGARMLAYRAAPPGRPPARLPSTATGSTLSSIDGPTHLHAILPPRSAHQCYTPFRALSTSSGQTARGAETTENGEEEWQPGTEEETQLY